MAEVYTIAGAPLGATNCPPGWTRTPNGNCGGAPPSYRAAAAVALQQALNAKGAGLKVDGIIGPATVAAVAKYTGQSLSIEDVAAQAQQLAQAVAAGGSGALFPPVVPVAKMSRGAQAVLWGLLGANILLAGYGLYRTYGNGFLYEGGRVLNPEYV